MYDYINSKPINISLVYINYRREFNLWVYGSFITKVFAHLTTCFENTIETSIVYFKGSIFRIKINVIKYVYIYMFCFIINHGY